MSPEGTISTTWSKNMMTRQQRAIMKIKRENTLMVGSRGRRKVRLKINHQQFELAEVGSIKEAEWYRVELAIALHRFRDGE
jgi:hypothetical protein